MTVWLIERTGRLEGHADNTSPGIHLEAAVPARIDRRDRETSPARPATVRLTGPLGGRMTTSDPERLRYEAARLLHAARLLELEQAPVGAPIPLDFQAMP